jgi:signal transduction histidine kinase
MSASASELQLGFEAFVSAAKSLEQSHATMKARAEAVDRELVETNARLEQALAERQELLDAVLADRERVVALEREVARLDRLAGLSELALGIAHEIKNPLNGVMGFAALVERCDDPVTVRRYCSKIRQGLARVDETVKSLLAFARPGHRAPARETVAACARRAARDAGLAASRVRLSGAHDEPVEGEALATVLTNLVRNSVEAGATSVTIEVEVRGAELVLRVGDDGPGIPRELGKKVLEPFVSTKSAGHGLGLALSARVLCYLEGSLDLLNPGERGACFEVRVPRTAAAEDPYRGEERGQRVGAARG